MWQFLIEQFPALIPFLTAVGGGIGTYLVTRINAKKEMTISDRVQLSKDQYQLIAELRTLMQDQKEETEELRKQVHDLQSLNVKLVVQNEKLQMTVDLMSAENEKLQEKVDELSRIVGHNLDAKSKE